MRLTFIVGVAFLFLQVPPANRLSMLKEANILIIFMPYQICGPPAG